MDIITTHVNADFDSLGSMVAAKKLYPQAVLAFPGSQEKTLRQFFVQSSLYAFDVLKAKQVDLDAVRRLILVDVAQGDRIGRFGELVGRPGVEVHVYDHHPPSDTDVPAAVRHVERVGAATTVLTGILRERRIPLTPEEATLMVLGIYEDTGGLTFSSTTPADLEAAAFLLAQGADLTAVPAFITPELAMEQISLLHELLQHREVHRVHGSAISVSEASRDSYIGDLAVLAHKIRDLENLDALVLLVRMEDRVHLVARSRVPEVDVGRLARGLGGGGHPEAASATVRELTLIQVRERVLELLPEVVQPRVTARDIWTTPVKTLPPDISLAAADEQLRRYHINAMPVVDAGRVVGLVTRQLVSRAVDHGLTGVPVAEYMLTEFATVRPGAPLQEVKERIIRGNQRFLPVVEGERLAGAVTRTDLLRALGGPEELEPVELPGEAQRRMARSLLEERLPAALLERLHALGARARALGMEAFLVGGVVRDVLLRRDNLDVDVVVEGDGIALAEDVAGLWGASVHPHRTFGTAKILCPDGFRLDVATARTEFYPQPAALPAVEWSSLKLDLYRRDFTVNTLALRLDPQRFGEVIDFFGGLRDLKSGTLRILHNLSFVEDPTRVLRAQRFLARFGFALGLQTQSLLRSAVKEGFLSQARGPRLFHEWVLLLQEADPERVLEEQQRFGVLAAFHPKLVLTPKARQLLQRVRSVVAWFRLLYLDAPVELWRVYLLAALDPLGEEDLAEWAAAFGIAGGEGRWVRQVRETGYRALVELRAELSRGTPRDSRVFAILQECQSETLLFLMAKTVDEEKRRLISRYHTRLAGTRSLLGGRDLRALGIPPGRIYATLLEGVLAARLDGEVTTREDELAWVERQWKAGSRDA
jgi:tRNA nucleotidyltransferase (CCA-adding enzyme)